MDIDPTVHETVSAPGQVQLLRHSIRQRDSCPNRCIRGRLAQRHRERLRAAVGAQRYTITGIVECDNTFCVTLPMISRERPRRPCEAMKIASHLRFFAAAMMPS